MLRERIARFVVAATVSVMFVFVTIITPRLKELAAPAYLVSAVGTILLSTTVYSLLATALTWLAERNLWMRRRLLGGSFLEGTWVGHYEWEGLHRFIVEHLDQPAGEIRIRGTEYDDAGVERCTWTSDTAAIVDDGRRLIYAYTCDMREGQKHQGMADFLLLQVHRSKPATGLLGWSADLVDGKKDPNKEVKVSDLQLDSLAALASARAHFRPATTAS